MMSGYYNSGPSIILKPLSPFNFFYLTYFKGSLIHFHLGEIGKTLATCINFKQHSYDLLIVMTENNKFTVLILRIC